MSQQIISPEVNHQAISRQRRPIAVARNRRDQAARKTFLVITIFPLILIMAVTIGLFWRSGPILSAYPLKDLFPGRPGVPTSVWARLVFEELTATTR